MAYGVSNSSKSSNFRKASLEVEAGGFSGKCLVPMGNGHHSLYIHPPENHVAKMMRKTATDGSKIQVHQQICQQGGL
jgi:hypothetical protein